jgi:chloramphenicol 3-O phosphotransferase
VSDQGGARGPDPGTVVVLNGTPRSGKSSIARALQRSAAGGPWLNLGVDALTDAIPEEVRPGIGLRPGGERPDLEVSVAILFNALYATVEAWSRAGLNVVVDVGHHDDYSRSLDILGTVAMDLAELPAYLVGVRCPVEVIMQRRDAGPAGVAGGAAYVTSEPDGGVPDIVLRWERAVHDPGVYDVEVDTSTASAEACAAAIVRRVEAGPPNAFTALAGANTPS